MNKIEFLNFKGGKKFNFEFAPQNYDKDVKLPRNIKIDFPKKYFRINPSVKKEIPSFEKLCEVVSYNFKTELILPFDVHVTGSSVTGIDLSIESRIYDFPETMSYRDLWLKTDIWTGFKNVITGGFINPHLTPERIFIELNSTEPFIYKPSEVEISGIFEALPGVFGKIFGADVPVTVLTIKDNAGLFKQAEKTLQHFPADFFVFKDKYPAPNAKLLLKDKKYPWRPSENPDKYVSLDFAALKRLVLLVNNRKYSPVSVAVGGNEKSPRFTEVYPWTYIADFTEFSGKTRCIAGGFMTGEEVDPSKSPVAPWHKGVNFIKNPEKREFLHFLRPGFRKDSVSPLVAGSLFPSTRKELNAGLRGERRSCLNCSACADICPMRLDPQLLYKNIGAGLKDEARKYGLLRCSECGLCSYVCPSKLELRDTIRNAKNEIFKNMRK